MPKKEEKKVMFTNSWFFIPLVVICAILAGMFGNLLTKGYFMGDSLLSSYSNYANEVNLSSLNTGNSGLVIRDPKKVVVNQDLKMAETISAAKSVLFGIFKKEDSAKAYYDLENPVFTALAITSDGWLLVPVDLSTKLDFEKDEYVAIDSGRKIYEIDEVSSSLEDNLLFIHLSGAQNLAIRKNAAKADFSLGQSLIVIKDFGFAKPATIVSMLAPSDVMSSESSMLDLKLDVNGEDLGNSFIFNLAGDLAAIIDNNGKAIPSYFYNYYWRSFLEKKDYGRAYLGVNYLDLSSVKMASSSISADKGALLFSVGNKPAVLKSSPAEKAGLQEGDLITWVNNQELSASKGLAEVISSYLPGESISLSVLRDGKEKQVNLVLGELK